MRRNVSGTINEERAMMKYMGLVLFVLFGLGGLAMWISLVINSIKELPPEQPHSKEEEDAK